MFSKSKYKKPMLCSRNRNHRNQNMVEDLDDLLKNLEHEYSKNTEVACDSELSKSSRKLPRSELSLDINEILALDLEEIECPNNATESIKVDKVKCHPIFIAGTEFGFGCSNSGDPKTCSALYCRNCDLKVTSFMDFEWKGNIDYLFLRTYMPNSKKIYEKLKRKETCIAYACQCVSSSADGLKVVESLPWFCRGHEKDVN